MSGLTKIYQILYILYIVFQINDFGSSHPVSINRRVMDYKITLTVKLPGWTHSLQQLITICLLKHDIQATFSYKKHRGERMTDRKEEL